jgi:HD-like signal output (HDOD) protein
LTAEVFGGDDPLGLREALQTKALRRSQAARVLSAELPNVVLAPEAALLADLGMCLLAQSESMGYGHVWRASQQGGSLTALERERYGTSHAEVGAAFLTLWHLPSVLVSAVAHHHRPVSEAAVNTASVVGLATLLEEESADPELTAEVDRIASLLGLAERVARVRQGWAA